MIPQNEQIFWSILNGTIIDAGEDDIDVVSDVLDGHPDFIRRLVTFNTNITHITAPKTFFSNLNRKSTTYEVNPWKEEVKFITGTDGFQFEPNEGKGETQRFYCDYLKSMIPLRYDQTTSKKKFGV